MRGYLTGVAWGLLVVGGGLAIASLTTPLPSEQSAVRGDASGAGGATGPAAPAVPTSDPKPQAPEGTPRVVPATPVATDVEAPAAPAVDGGVTAEAALQDNLAAALEETPEEAVQTVRRATDEVPLPAGSQFGQPPDDLTPEVAPAQDAAPFAEAPRTAALAESDKLVVPPAPSTAPAATPVAVQTTEAAPTPQLDTAVPVVSDALDPAAPPPSFQPEPLANPLPQIGAVEDAEPQLPGQAVAPLTTEAASLDTEGSLAPPEADTPSEGPLVEEVPVQTEFLPALLAHAVPFENPQNKPLFSIVLIDTPASRLDRATLSGFSFPVAFAIDATSPDAAETAAFYRDAGFEVLIRADSLPRRGTPADYEVAIEASRTIIPEAVAILDSKNSFLQRTPEALNPVLDILSDTGHGFLAFPERLNPGVLAARRTQVPALPAYRILDAEEERSTVITRYLDRASFNAGQQGQTIVVGHTYADTVTALYAWKQSARSDAVAIAPISAVLDQLGRDE